MHFSRGWTIISANLFRWVFAWVIKMLEYGRIDISERIDINKTNVSKEWKICHYWYFKDIGFKYEPHLCNVCHGFMQKAVSFNNIAIVYVKRSAYKIQFWYMTKDDAINMVLVLLIKWVFYNFFFIFFFLLYMKMSESTDLTYYQLWY